MALEELQNIEHDRRRGVIRKVTGDAQPRLSKIGRPETVTNPIGGDVEKISDDNCQLGVVLAPERSSQVPIHFEGDDMLRNVQQWQSQRTAAGSDFKKDILRLRVDRRDDLLNPGPLKNMLSEPLSRPRESGQRAQRSGHESSSPSSGRPSSGSSDRLCQ